MQASEPILLVDVPITFKHSPIGMRLNVFISSSALRVGVHLENETKAHSFSIAENSVIIKHCSFKTKYGVQAMAFGRNF